MSLSFVNNAPYTEVLRVDCGISAFQACIKTDAEADTETEEDKYPIVEFLKPFMASFGFEFLYTQYKNYRDCLYLFYNDDAGEDWCIEISPRKIMLMIAVNIHRNVAFTQETYKRVHDYFFTIFNAINIAFNGNRSICELCQLLEPNWFATFRDESDACADHDARENVLDKFQSLFHMNAITRILAMVPTGSYNPYANYVKSFFESVDILTALTKLPASFEFPDNEFALDHNTHFDVLRRQDPDIDTALDENPQEAMLLVLNKYFNTSDSIAVVIKSGYIRAGICLTEESFRALFHVYIQVVIDKDYDFSTHSDTELIQLAYLAECINDKNMILQIINYFLPFRFEYLKRAWSPRVIPSISFEAFPSHFNVFTPPTQAEINFATF